MFSGGDAIKKCSELANPTAQQSCAELTAACVDYAVANGRDGWTGFTLPGSEEAAPDLAACKALAVKLTATKPVEGAAVKLFREQLKLPPPPPAEELKRYVAPAAAGAAAPATVVVAPQDKAPEEAAAVVVVKHELTDAELFPTAQQAEAEGKFVEAAPLYRKYASLPSTQPKEVADALYHAARCFEKAQKGDEFLDVAQEFRRRFGKSKDHGARVVEFYYREGLVYAAKNDDRAARQMRLAVKEFGERRFKPGSESAEFSAAATFWLVEEKFKQFVAQPGNLVRMRQKVSELDKEYGKVVAYDRTEWAVNALTRQGELYDRYALALAAASRPEAETQAAVKEAIKRYDLCLTRAGQTDNDWTKKARARRNALQLMTPEGKAEHRAALATAAAKHAGSGKWDELVALFTSEVAADPMYAKGWYYLGLAQRKLGKHAEAIDAYRKYNKLNPNDPPTYFGLGMSLGALGKTELAIAALETYLRLETREGQDAAKDLARKELAKLKGEK